jgi:plastocyanin domain-containing protein
MFMFALGSMLSLSFISFASVGFGTHKLWSGRFNTVAGMMVLFFALFTFNSQLNALGLPSANDVTLLFRSSDNTAQTVFGDQNVQIMSMEASAYGYSPTSFTVKAGIPVRWEINNIGASGCTNAIIARDFFSGQFPLNPGMNVIEFTPQTPGTYKFSCWMGMVSGVIKVM